MKPNLFFILSLAVLSFACTVEWVTPTATPQASLSLPTVTAQALPTVTPTPESLAAPAIEVTAPPAGKNVIVAYDLVNIRFADHSATGTTVSRGKVLAVVWLDNGYGEIVGGDLQGFYIWRGCTNDPGKYKCVTANR